MSDAISRSIRDEQRAAAWQRLRGLVGDGLDVRLLERACLEIERLRTENEQLRRQAVDDFTESKEREYAAASKFDEGTELEAQVATVFNDPADFHPDEER